MEDNANIYLLINYLLEVSTSLDNLRRSYPNLIFTRITAGIYTIQVPAGAENEFNLLQENIRYIDIPTLLGLSDSQALEASGISVFHDYPYGALRGNGVLIGFVDTGIDYTNEFFKNADGTSRIVSIWDQTIPGNPPPEFGYGSTYSQEQLNEALRQSDPYSVVPTRDTNGHGTMLAGLAAGNDQSDRAAYTGAAPDADIIMVKLRPASQLIRDVYMVNEGAVAYQSNDILTGIQYLINRASILRQPIVICVALGDTFGPHNGTSVIEQYLEMTGLSNGVVTVVAVGNEANSGHHYRGELQPNSPVNIELDVSENERGFLMALWANIASRIYVSFRSPLGQTIARVPIINRRSQMYRFNLEPTMIDVHYLYTDPFTGEEGIAIRFITPTPGIWTITAESDTTIDGTFHVWLQREGFMNAQTRFLEPNPNYTIQIPSTAEYIISVGAYDAVDNSIYVSSGRGPTRNNVIKPDIIAPGVNVEAPRVGGGVMAYTGTSVAAAITAGAAALLLQWAILNGNLVELNTRIARGILIRGARRMENVVYPNNIEGYGRLDLINSISNN